MHEMNKITQLISLLGGTGVLSKKLKIQPSAISNWKKLNKIVYKYLKNKKKLLKEFSWNTFNNFID